MRCDNPKSNGLIFVGSPKSTKKVGKLNKKEPLPPIAHTTSSTVRHKAGKTSDYKIDSTLRDSIATSDIDIDVDK